MSSYMKTSFYLAAGAAIRYILYINFFHVFSNRVEISTPMNAYKRLQEGIFLYNRNSEPYYGDMVHETPTMLVFLAWIHNNIPQLVPVLYIIVDLLTAIILSKMSEIFCNYKLKQEQTEKHNYAEGTKENIQFLQDYINIIPKNVLLTYLFNPLTLINCAGLTTTVFSNLFLALFMYFLLRKQFMLCLTFLAFETTRNLYPFALIAPVILMLEKRNITKGAGIVVLFTCLTILFSYVNLVLNKGSLSFLNSTFGFIFFYRDLQPNIGLFWYFFTEMFEHFRSMFLITFQMNATVLYIVPLSFRLRKDPVMLTTILLALMAIFKSYPCIGDVSLYLAMLPIWKQCWKFMSHNFIVFCFFLITILLMPALWHLWIYCGSANANFYFGATLAFATGQIFLVTDLLFAYAKLEFCLKNGLIDGKEAKIVLG